MLERTPYDARLGSDVEIVPGEQGPPDAAELARAYCRNGWAYVVQDCRGRWRSEGVFDKYVCEAEDGADTIDWIARQDWSDGRVVTVGFSYGASAQLAAACMGAEALSGMLLDCGGFANAFESGVRQGGAFDLKQASWAAAEARKAAKAGGMQSTVDDIDRRMVRRSLEKRWVRGRSPAASAPALEESAIGFWENETDGPFWHREGLCANRFADRVPNVPVVHISSWFDASCRSAISNYRGLAAAGNERQALVIGPWVHGKRNQSHAGELDFGPSAPFHAAFGKSYAEFRFEAVAAALAGEVRPSGVHYFRMGGGSGRRNRAGHIDHGGGWLAAPSWPPAAATVSFALGADNALAVGTDIVKAGTCELISDPSYPVPAIGGAMHSSGPIMFGGAFDQVEDARFGLADGGGHRPKTARGDVVSLISAPLTAPLDVTGEPWLDVTVSTDGEDGDIAVVLIDVYPETDGEPGPAINVADGIQRMRFRNGGGSADPMGPGGPVTIRVRLSPVSNLFLPGHRLRVDIAGSHFPRFDINPNCIGGPPRVARHTLHFGGENGSLLHLPVPDPSAVAQ